MQRRAPYNERVGNRTTHVLFVLPISRSLGTLQPASSTTGIPPINGQSERNFMADATLQVRLEKIG